MANRIIPWLAGVSTGYCAVATCFIPPLAATLLRNVFPCLMHFDWNSEGWCMGVFAVFAYGLGKLAGNVAGSKDNKAVAEYFSEGSPGLEVIHGQLIAGIAGLLIGFIPVFFFSSSC